MQQIADDTPNGFCKKCGFPQMIGRGNQKTCPNCASQHNEVSTLVNETPDPGHAALVKELGTMIKPEERKAAAPDSDAKAYIGVAAKPTIKIPIVPEDAVIPSGLTSTEQAIEFLRNHFKALPVSDLEQAKKLLKLRREIDKLAEKIQTFVGGNTNV